VTVDEVRVRREAGGVQRLDRRGQGGFGDVGQRDDRAMLRQDLRDSQPEAARGAGRCSTARRLRAAERRFERAHHRGADRARRVRVDANAGSGAFDGGGLHERDHRVLGRAAGAQIRAAESGRRCGHDDRAAARAARHVSQCRAQSEEDSAQVDGHDAIERRHGLIGQRRRRSGNAGIEEHPVDPSEGRDRRRRVGLDLLLA